LPLTFLSAHLQDVSYLSSQISQFFLIYIRNNSDIIRSFSLSFSLL